MITLNRNIEHEIKETLLILGVDPGNNTGLTLLYFDRDYPYNIRKIYSSTYVMQHGSKYEPSVNNNYKLLVQSVSIYNSFFKLLCTYHPNLVAVEDVYISRVMPNAALQLIQYLRDIENAIYRYNDPFLQLVRVPATVVKKTHTGKGTAKKEDMLEALNNNTELTSNLDHEPQTEHEIDSIAIAYTAYLEFKNDPSLLYKDVTPYLQL